MSRTSVRKRNETDAKAAIEKGVAGVANAFDVLLVAVRGNAVPLSADQVEGIGNFLRGLADRSAAAIVAANASAQAASFSLDAIPSVTPASEPVSVVFRSSKPPFIAERQVPQREIEGPPPAAQQPVMPPRQPDQTTAQRPLGRVAAGVDDPNAGKIVTGAPIRGSLAPLDNGKQIEGQPKIDADGFI